jgi:predicted transcriptional regulator
MRSKLKTISVKLPRSVSERVSRLAEEGQTTVSAIVRDALEHYDGQLKNTFADVAARYAGCLEGGPGDLSTNSEHLADFGK